MARFRVKGESSVEWELEVKGDLDHNDATLAALEYVADMLQLDHGQTVAGSFTVPACRIVGQEDRIIRNVELCDDDSEKDDE